MSRNAVFGIVPRRGALDPAWMDRLHAAMAESHPAVWSDGTALVGRTVSRATPAPGLPLTGGEQGVVVAAAGRLDNREELIASLHPAAGGEVRDQEIIRAAYLRWGPGAPPRLRGDWSLAAWHVRERRLFLARDPYGATGLYYYADARTLAFAPTQRALLSLGVMTGRVDELYVAQFLISATALHGPRSPIVRLRLLPPAHALAATPERLDVSCYWRMEDTRVRALPGGRTAYVNTFRELLDAAVRIRLRADGPVASMLSSGLDSGSVTALAAAHLHAGGQRLRAYTSVPLWPAVARLPGRATDEWSLAHTVAGAAGNIDHEPVAAESLSPVGAIRRVLAIVEGPVHNAGNFYWLLELYRAARDSGHVVLLTGGIGNASVSWFGSPWSQSLGYQLRHLGARRWLKTGTRRVLPPTVNRRIAAARLPADWYRRSAIHPDLVRRTDLSARHVDELAAPPRPGRGERFELLLPGRFNGGAIQASLGAAYGLEIRDPTADVELLSFVLSVPDSVFIDPAADTDRWLIREAMQGRLPDVVRLNTVRGQQAADLVPRLRVAAEEVEETLDEIEHGAGASFVDVSHMRSAWNRIRTENSPQTFRAAVSILTRGLMGGLHVNAVARGVPNAEVHEAP